MSKKLKFTTATTIIKGDRLDIYSQRTIKVAIEKRNAIN